MNKLANEDVDYNGALKYFTLDEIKKTILDTVGGFMQDVSIFEMVADEKSIDDITIEDILDLLFDDFDFKSDFMYDLFAISAVNDNESLAEEADENTFDVPDIINHVINECPDIRNKLNADLEIARSTYKHNNAAESGIKNARELRHNDDNIGDVIQCSNEFNIDLGNRTGAFIYIRGNIIVGKPNETHSDLINKYFNNENIPSKRIRSIDAIDELEDGEPVAFGHIADSMAFIQVLENCSVDEVVNALQKNGSYKKIYDYDYEMPELTRLAKNKL